MHQTNSIVGAALVVGGGIGGIQTSLDLANSGFQVYLVDKAPTIGGIMTQLDKTFPTCDCSICILSPKLVECGRHPNVKVMSYSELLEVEGAPGNFKVKVGRHARYVNESMCTGCGECTNVCPISVPSEYDEGLTTRKAIYRPFAQAYPGAFVIDKKGKSPCSATCPAGVNPYGYIALIAQGKFKEALESVRRSMPFAGVCGRVCTHPCEDECERNEVDQPVAIRDLKRFLADYELENGREKPAPVALTKSERVAVVGSGPAGIACAYDLIRAGYPVTVFEAAPQAGGLLRYAIPEYRLPKAIIEEEIEYVKNLGVEIKTGAMVKNLGELVNQGFKAVFLACGAGLSQKMGVPGEEGVGVFHALDFLKIVNSKVPVQLGSRVAVVGGGNAAVDAARVALRLGSKEVRLIYRRSRAEMPAMPAEVTELVREGVAIEFLTTPIAVLLKNGRLTGIRCQKMDLGQRDASGRRRAIPIAGSEYEINLDNLIIATGQTVDKSLLPNDLLLTNYGTARVNPITLETNIKGVFAGGDLVSGPTDVVHAIAQGKEAAISIDRFLRGVDMRESRPEERQRVKEVLKKGIQTKARAKMPELDVSKRINSFKEVEGGLDEKTAVAEAQRCLHCAVCSECLECVKVCERKAINHTMQEETTEFTVGSIILSPGESLFDPSSIFNYGYGVFPNVVTSLEFERMLSASGPYQGDLKRPSDKKSPRSVAWIQCVGSREVNNEREYCSSVCCTYGIKEAIVAREHVPHELEETIFYMDIRTHGKGFEAFYNRAKGMGINFVKSKISQISQNENTGNLILKYSDESGRLLESEYDIVVLSVGFQSSPDAIKLAKKLGVQLDPYGFCHTEPFTPVESSRPGIFVCGAFSSPKDIPETVVQASAAAAEVGALLAPGRNTLTKIKSYPLEKDISGQKPRVGVFICHCGINIGGYIDIPGVTEYAKKLPDVAYAENNLYTCSQDTQERIKRLIEEQVLNRVVVASCSPRTHEPLFQETIKEAGLNRYLFEMANIRDQCSWVHMHEREKATEKAKNLVAMAVAKARLILPLKPPTIGVHHTALVVGGGVAGMTAALKLADQGFEVHLIEKGKTLGGMARRVKFTIEGKDVKAFVSKLIQQVQDHALIKTYLNSRIITASGYVGNFTTRVMQQHSTLMQKIEHGITILASGAAEYKPEEYLYGSDPRVLTQLELEEEMDIQNPEIAHCNNIVMIQCVGSRSEKYNYCSRVCCKQAVKNALKLKELKPEMNVYVLYQDIRTYSLSESYYKEAREKGVIFMRYSPTKKPEVRRVMRNEEPLLQVNLQDPLLGVELTIETDLLVLSVATVAPPETKELAMFYKVPQNEDGFFVEAHVKLRPVDFATEGVFVCGLAHSPKSIEESIAQAGAAASRASTILTKDFLTAEGIVCAVNEEVCGGCGICQILCPYQAITVDPARKVAVVNEVLCKGCGTCASACPSGAAQQRSFTRNQISAILAAALTEV